MSCLSPATVSYMDLKHAYISTEICPLQEEKGTNGITCRPSGRQVELDFAIRVDVFPAVAG